ncbi:hypothetical protein LA080_000480 [Diaporthe eres]|nr:hypothetical protein LA080_000480 [Diaporthe eres]
MSTNSKGPKTASVQSLRSGNSGDTRSISTTSEGFENSALDNGVLDAVRSGKQAVVDSDVKMKLLASRESASPTQSQYDKFADRIVEASNEQGTIAVYSKYIFQDTEDTHFDIGYRRKEDKMWTEFPKNVGFNNGLSAPKPDMIEGFPRDTFPPTIEDVKASRLVRDEPRYVALPHMAVEYKAREKSLHEAKVQAGYDGAAMVYGRNEALKYIGKADPPRQPAVLTATTIGQEWKVYGHCAHPNDSNGKEEYYQCRMAGGSMENLSEYKQGRKVLRNMTTMSTVPVSSASSLATRRAAILSPPNHHPLGLIGMGNNTHEAKRRLSQLLIMVPLHPLHKTHIPGNGVNLLLKYLASKLRTMPPPVRHVQPHKPSTTIPGFSEASEAPHAHQNSPLPGPPRRTSSGPGGGQLPTAQPESAQRTTTVKPPD